MLRRSKWCYDDINNYKSVILRTLYKNIKDAWALANLLISNQMSFFKKFNYNLVRNWWDTFHATALPAPLMQCWEVKMRSPLASTLLEGRGKGWKGIYSATCASVHVHLVENVPRYFAQDCRFQTTYKIHEVMMHLRLCILLNFRLVSNMTFKTKLHVNTAQKETTPLKVDHVTFKWYILQ